MMGDMECGGIRFDGNILLVNLEILFDVGNLLVSFVLDLMVSDVCYLWEW